MDRFVHLSIPRRNIDGDFEITSFQIDLTTMSCIIGVRSASSDAYDFDAAAEEGEQPDPASTANDNPSVDGPSPPTSLSATVSVFTVTVAFVAPNDVNVYDCRVYRGTTVFGSATDISGPMYCTASQMLNWNDVPGHGTWNYWVIAESLSGAGSGAVGPAIVTI